MEGAWPSINIFCNKGMRIKFSRNKLEWFANICMVEIDPVFRGNDTRLFMKRNYDDLLTFIQPLKSSLLAFCRQTLWKPGEVEDVLQTALTTALQAFPQFEEGTHFRAWIFKHLQHAVWNANRRSRRAPQSGFAEGLEEPSAADVFEQEWTYHELLQHPEVLYESFDDRVRKALVHLPDPERVVFLLRSIGELSYREIAGVLQIPVGTVMGELSRARAKLRESLVFYAREVGWKSSPGGPS